MKRGASIQVACGARPEAEEQNSPTRSLEPHVLAGAQPNNNTILGMELPSAWSIATAGATLAQSTTHTEGSYALAVRPSNSNGYTPIKSVPMNTLAAVSPTLAVDIRLPSYQPNPNWLGTVQATIDCPSRGIYSQFLNQVALTGKPLNTWFTVNFTLTNDWVSRFLQYGYADLTITIALNVQVPTTGTYLIDNVRFVPLASNNCAGTPNGTQCATGVCLNGTCAACTAGTSCQPSDACQTGAISCSTGTPVCRAMGSKPAGTSCGTNMVCDASGICAIDPCSPAAVCGTRQCGTASTGCGKTVSCGTCQTGQTCNSAGQCVCWQKSSNSLLTNPGFDGSAAGWTLSGGAAYSSSDADVCSGSGSVVLTGLMDSFSQCVAIGANVAYNFGFEYKGMAMCDTSYFTTAGCTGDSSAGVTVLDTAGKSTWTLGSAKGQTGPGTGSLQVHCSAAVGSGNYDQFVLSAGS